MLLYVLKKVKIYQEIDRKLKKCCEPIDLFLPWTQTLNYSLRHCVSLQISTFGARHIYLIGYREFVADSVIQASGTVEFEDGLRTGVLLQDC